MCDMGDRLGGSGLFETPGMMVKLPTAFLKGQSSLELPAAFRHSLQVDCMYGSHAFIVQIFEHTTINTRVIHSTHYSPPLSSSPSASLSL